MPGEAIPNRAALLALALLLPAPGAGAAETPAPPDAALLEFIGSFATDDGEWIDPMTLDENSADGDDADEVKR